MEGKSFAAGFAAGSLTLVLAIGGHLAWREPASCASSPQRAIAARLLQKLKPRSGVAQKIAFAVLGAVLRETSCS